MLKALALTLIALVYTVGAIISMLDGRALEARGKDAVIEPMETVTEITRTRAKQTVMVSYEGRIRFETDDGRPVEVKKYIPAPLLDDLANGKPVLIRYLPDKPTTARLPGDQGSDSVDVAIGSIFLLAGGMWVRKKLLEKPRLG
jgi:hypothetical protein